MTHGKNASDLLGIGRPPRLATSTLPTEGGPIHTAARQSGPARSFAIVAGVLSVALLVGAIILVALAVHGKTPAQELGYADGHKAVYAVAGVAALFWASFAVPFVVGFGRLIRDAEPYLASAATILLVAGVLLFGFGIYVGWVGSTLSIMAAGTVHSHGTGPYQMAIWSHLSPLMTDPALMVWGLGQVLLGWMAWRSTRCPDGIAAVAIVGGGASMLAALAAPGGAIPLALLSLACFSVVAFLSAAVVTSSESVTEVNASSQRSGEPATK